MTTLQQLLFLPHLCNNNGFLENLDGIQVAGGLLFAQDHLAKRPFAQHFEEIKVVQGLQARQYNHKGNTGNIQACTKSQQSASTEEVCDERERENSNSKTLFYKDCSLGSFKNLSNN